MAEDEEEIDLEDLERQLKEQKVNNQYLNNALSNTSYSMRGDENLIQYQLDTAEMKSQIEHFLRGDIITIDNEGDECWTKQKNKDLILFNDYGVNSIMLIIGNYIDKNTMLSYYDENRINEILADLAEKLAKFIFYNYEKMGMDTEFKKTRFPITVLTIIHAIESAYRRAIRGRTSEDINTSKIFTQSDLLGGRGSAMLPKKKKFNLFNPSTYFS